MEPAITYTSEKFIVGIKIYIPGHTEIIKSAFELTSEQLEQAEVTFSGTNAGRPAGHDEQELFLSTMKLKYLLGPQMDRMR